MARHLRKVAAHVRVISIEQKDLTAWREAGGDKAALDALIDRTPDQLRPDILFIEDNNATPGTVMVAGVPKWLTNFDELSEQFALLQAPALGVWNRTSEGGLKILNVWPDFDHGASPGKRYRTINDVLLQLREQAGCGSLAA